MMNKTSLRASTKYIFNCMEYNPYVFEASHFELVGSNQLGNFSLKVPFDHMSTGTQGLHDGSNGFFLLFRHFICPPAPGSPTSNNCYLKINPQYRKNWEYYIFYITAKNTLNPQAPWHWEKLEHFKVGKKLTQPNKHTSLSFWCFVHFCFTSFLYPAIKRMTQQSLC